MAKYQNFMLLYLVFYMLYTYTCGYTNVAHSKIARSRLFSYNEGAYCLGDYENAMNTVTEMGCYQACFKQNCSAVNYKGTECKIFFCKPPGVTADAWSSCYIAVDDTRMTCSKFIFVLLIDELCSE